MVRNRIMTALIFTLMFSLIAESKQLERVKYNNPGLVVDLGVGLWATPLPMDYTGNGYYDLVVSCTDKPYNGVYLFENPGDSSATPVFKPPRKISGALSNIQVSHLKGEEKLLVKNFEIIDIRENGISKRKKIYPSSKIHQTDGRIRANQWKYCDYNGNGVLDLIVGIGDWTDYGWDNAYDENGNWQNGPLHGYVYLIENTGTSEDPDYKDPVKVLADGKPIDVYGMPSPSFADFDGDGDLDIVCGEFVDTLTYFENIGTRTEPQYAKGCKLKSSGEIIRMDLCMITPTAFDWTKNGFPDIIVGEEDGTVSLIENTGRMVDGEPDFKQPVKFQQQAEYVKYGALVTPVSFDWDGDGREDLICGNTAGNIGFIRNLGVYDGKIRWAKPVNLKAGGEDIRIMAGEKGSIQGPCERKWGYTTLSVADWDGDGLPDIVVNSIWGKIQWFRNIGTRTNPELIKRKPVKIAWDGKPLYPEWNWWKPEDDEFVTQWRTTPFVTDFNSDGLKDIVMIDHEGYLAYFERAIIDGKKTLTQGKRIFNSKGVSDFNPRGRHLNDSGGLLRLNSQEAGRSGRRKFYIFDWDGDGKEDILANGVNVNFMQNISRQKDNLTFGDKGRIDSRIIAGHTTSPTPVNWDEGDLPGILIGAEDGHFYYKPNPAGENDL